MPPPPASGDLNNRPELDTDIPIKHISGAAPNSPSRQAFDLSTSKWGHGSPFIMGLSWASFVPFSASYALSFST